MILELGSYVGNLGWLSKLSWWGSNISGELFRLEAMRLFMVFWSFRDLGGVGGRVKRAPGAKTPDLQCLALPGNRRTLAWEESGVIARLGASGDQWAVPRAQSRRTEPYWEPGEVEEEGVHSGGEVELLVVSREVKHHSMAKLSKSLWLATKGPTQRQKTNILTCALPPSHRWIHRWRDGPQPFALSRPC